MIPFTPRHDIENLFIEYYWLQNATHDSYRHMSRTTVTTTWQFPYVYDNGGLYTTNSLPTLITQYDSFPSPSDLDTLLLDRLFD
jgi:hypothetical protein